MSLFGASSATPATGGSSSLFGSNTSSNTSAGTLFGGGGNTGASKPTLSMNTNTSNSSAGTLFGGPASSTPTTSSTSLFGKPAQTSSAGSLFGNSTSTPASGGGLFGNSTATPANNTSSLFGNTSNNNASNTSNSTMPGMSSIFGGLGAPAASTASSTSNNIFGSATPAASSGTNIFGQSSTAPASTGASLFGQSTAAPASSGTNIFGQSTAAPSSGTNLFGQPKPATSTGSLFGNTQPTTTNNTFNQPQQTQTQSSSLMKPMFSSTTTYQPQQTQRSLFSTSIGQTLGLASGSQTTTIPGVRIDVSNIKPTTRFSDLYEGLQKEIEAVDAFITSQISFNEACERIMPKIEERLSTVPNDVSYCETQLDNVQRALESDASSIEDAKRSVKTDAEDASLSFDGIHNLKLPPQFQRVRQSANETKAESEGERERDLSTYFGAQINEMGSKLAGLKGTLGQIESYLSSMEQAQMVALTNGRPALPKSADEKVREMAGVLKEFEGGILGVAMKVGNVRDEVARVVMNSNAMGRGYAQGRW